MDGMPEPLAKMCDGSLREFSRGGKPRGAETVGITNVFMLIREQMLGQNDATEELRRLVRLLDGRMRSVERDLSAIERKLKAIEIILRSPRKTRQVGKKLMEYTSNGQDPDD